MTFVHPFCVQAGALSDALHVTTAPGPPDSPTQLSVSSRSTSVAYVTWEKPCSNGADVNEYRLERASENGSFTTVSTGSFLVSGQVAQVCIALRSHVVPPQT